MKAIIKGSCESCGFDYTGSVKLVDKSFPDIKCPKCGKETQNFDDASEVDANDKYEGRKVDYKKVVFA